MKKIILLFPVLYFASFLQGQNTNSISKVSSKIVEFQFLSFIDAPPSLGVLMNSKESKEYFALDVGAFNLRNLPPIYFSLLYTEPISSLTEIRTDGLASRIGVSLNIPIEHERLRIGLNYTDRLGLNMTFIL